MAEKRIARHRANTRTSTPLTQAIDVVANVESGKRLLALAGSGAAVGAIAAALPASPVENSAAAQTSIDTSSVAKSVMDNAVLNPSVTVKGADVVESASVKVAVKDAGQVAVARPAEVGQSAEKEIPANLPPSDSRVLAIGARYLGAPYVWGAAGPSAFDCSGFVQYVFKQVGINLPHGSAAMRNYGTAIPVSAAQPGDILWSPSHVGIYAGNGMVLETMNPRQGVGYYGIQWTNFSVALRF